MVWSRPDCSLCDEFVTALAEELAASGATFRVLDVDEDDAARRRFGLKIPVLTLDGRLVCAGRLDRAALRTLIAHGP